MSCIFVIWKLTQVPLSPCRLACDNFQPPFGQSWFTRSARAASLQWYIFSSQLIILTSLKDESGKILKRLLALSSLEIGIDANRKKKRRLHLLIGPLVKFSMQEQQQLKTCWYLPTIFVAISQEIPPPSIRPFQTQNWLFWGWKNTTASYRFNSPFWLEGPIADPKGTQKIIHYFMCESNKSKPDQSTTILGFSLHVNQWKHPMPEAEFLWKVNRLGTAICFVTKDIYLCRMHFL